MSQFVKKCEELWKDADAKTMPMNQDWSLDDAAVYVAAWLDWHGTVDAVPGLRQALEVAEPHEIEALRKRMGVGLRLDRAGIKSLSKSS